MIARKNPSTGKWDAQYSYTDWQGKRKKTTKRGFRTKREAVEWYDHFRATQDADFNMVFKDLSKSIWKIKATAYGSIQ